MKFTKKEKSIISSVVDDRCLDMAVPASNSKNKDAKKYFKELRRLSIKIDKWQEEK